MQFARIQGAGLAAIGLLLIALQVYIVFWSTLQPGSPTQAPPALPGGQIVKFVPGILGLVAFAGGAYLIVLQRKQGGSQEAQPAKTKSGIPM
jgi:hypothetical protein